MEGEDKKKLGIPLVDVPRSVLFSGRGPVPTALRPLSLLLPPSAMSSSAFSIAGCFSCCRTQLQCEGSMEFVLFKLRVA